MAKCDTCAADDAAVALWQKSGGLMPPKTCKKRHGRACQDCGQKTRNPSRRCGKCFNLHWKRTYGIIPLTGG